MGCGSSFLQVPAFAFDLGVSTPLGRAFSTPKLEKRPEQIHGWLWAVQAVTVSLLDHAVGMVRLAWC
jgi:hypothetical protein